MDRFDVAIVGFGPVGAVLANLLGARSMSVVVLEREPAIHSLPRACHLDDTSLRILQEVGLAEGVLAASVPSLGMDLLDRRGRRFLTFAADHESNLFGYPTSVLFWQPEFETILRRGVGRFGAVDVRLGSEALGVEPIDGGWRLRYGAGSTVDARFVVGCDGARSTVRNWIGADLVDLNFDQPWLVVDVELRSEAELPDRIVQYCDPRRPTTYVPLPGRYRRWELMALPGEQPTDLEKSQVIKRLLKPWLSTDRFDIVRGAVYRFHALVADRWGDGGLFIAGDAAHQMPPFLGQGMCSGIRDAANLAWKLARVCEGRAGVGFLDSYAQERAPHVERLAERAIEVGRMIQVTEEEAAQQERVELATVRGDSGAAPLTAGFLERGSPGAGELLPQPLHEDRPLDDHLGFDFSVVTSSPMRSVPLPAVHSPALTPWLRKHGAAFAIVRPDRYVYSTGSEGELGDSVERLLQRLVAFEGG